MDPGIAGRWAHDAHSVSFRRRRANKWMLDLAGRDARGRLTGQSAEELRASRRAGTGGVDSSVELLPPDDPEVGFPNHDRRVRDAGMRPTPDMLILGRDGAGPRSLSNRRYKRHTL